MSNYVLYYGASKLDPIYSVKASSCGELLHYLTTFLTDWYSYPCPVETIKPNKIVIDIMARKLVETNIVSDWYRRPFFKFALVHLYQEDEIE